MAKEVEEFLNFQDQKSLWFVKKEEGPWMVGLDSVGLTIARDEKEGGKELGLAQ